MIAIHVRRQTILPTALLAWLIGFQSVQPVAAQETIRRLPAIDAVGADTYGDRTYADRAYSDRTYNDPAFADRSYATSPAGGAPRYEFPSYESPQNSQPLYRTAREDDSVEFNLPPPVGWTPDDSFIQQYNQVGDTTYGDTAVSGWSTSKISSQKPGIFQRFTFTAAWLDGDGPGDVGMTELEMYATFALPLPTNDHPLLITPGFETIFLDGPATPDLPGQVYSMYTQFLWMPRINQRWTAFLGINPGIYGDLETGTDTFRLLGRGLARFDWIPGCLQLTFGILYLDRDDFSILPAGGLTWTPHDDLRFDIMFPQPKFAYRLAYSDQHEDWLYLAGEFGGDTWAVRRASGADDRITMRDLRLLLGLERKLDGGAGARLELGYVFSRTIEYSSATPDIDLSGTLLIRGGFSF